MRMNAYGEPEKGSLPDEEQVDLAVEVFRMLADATRIKLLWILANGEAAVSDLTEAVAKPQALVSQHLAKLRLARLVTTPVARATRCSTDSRTTTSASWWPMRSTTPSTLGRASRPTI